MFWNKRRIYADAAAATPLSERARREFERLLPIYGNPGALHKEALAAKEELEKARRTIAQSIGATPEEIIFTASGTEGNNLALQGIVRPLMRTGSVHAVTLSIEHQSVLEPLRALAREGMSLTELPVDEHGLVSSKDVLGALREDTALVSVQLVNSEVGVIEPVRDIAKALNALEDAPLLHTDASQAPLWLSINVERLGVDLMTLDAQKVLGPKGVGCLYVRRGIPIESVLWGGRQERGVRGGTENAPAAGAFAVALKDAQEGFKERAAHVAEVRDYLWQEIKRLVPDAILNGPTLDASRAANSLNVSVPNLEAEMAVVSMDALGVAVSTRSACNIGSEEPSHVIKALGIPRELAGTAIRITLLPSASTSDARAIAQALYQTEQLYRSHTSG